MINIAHISDLHCNGSLEWEKNFRDKVVDYLFNLPDIPQLIAITGDSVHQPTENNFVMLVNNISFLREKLLSRESNLHIVTVPGNHDYHYFGNKVLPDKFSLPQNIPIRSKFFKIPNVFSSSSKMEIPIKKDYRFKKHLPDLLFPGGTWQETISSFFETFSVAIFPLDSVSGFSPFAGGRVKEPDFQLEQYNAEFLLISESNGIKYSDCSKIILLHHHPLPLPTPTSEFKTQPFLQLDNSHELLRAACDIGASLIMHGHKHISGISQYKIYDGPTDSIIVSSCGTTGWYSRDQERELKTILLASSGECSIASHIRVGLTDFRIMENREIISYGEVRKLRSTTEFKRSEDIIPIEHVNYKKKIVNIDTDGGAMIDLSFEGIKWKEEIGPYARFVKEKFFADTGRIIRGVYEFGRGKLWQYSNSSSWMHPLIGEKDYPNADQTDSFEKDFRSSGHGVDDDLDCCRITYLLANGFALNKQEHDVCYKDWTEPTREEISCIETDYPVDFLHLIVTFPANTFPDPRYVRVEATKKSSLEGPTDTELLYRRYETISEETEFLTQKNAIKFHPEINAIELVIKYPQTELVYILRWAVSERVQPFKLSPYDKRKIHHMRTEFNNNKSQQLQNFYEYLTSSFKNTPFELFLLGYNAQLKELIATKYDEKKYQAKTGLLVGRGPAGLAFKTKKAIYWEKDDEGARINVEPIIEGLKPIIVFSLPLMHPFDRMINLRGEVFGILSIVAETEIPRLSTQEPVGVGERLLKDEKTAEESRPFVKGFITDVYDNVNKGLVLTFPEWFNKES